MNRDISAEITAQIVAAIERGGLKWLRGWRSQFPRSIASGKQYNGINALLLFASQEAHGYASPYWVTFREAQKRGGHVKKGEKATPIIFYEMRQRTERNAETGNDDVKTFPFMRLYYVFNIAQTEGVTAPETAPQFSPIENAERIASGYAVTVRYGGDSAHYAPKDDYVQLPVREAFHNAQAFYATLFHEYAHSTGAKHRLNRELSTKFGSDAYAYEELIAELCSAFTCASVGIEGDAAIQNNAAYVANWLQALKDDKRLIFKAAKAAQEAHDYIVTNGGKVADTDKAAQAVEVQE